LCELKAVFDKYQTKTDKIPKKVSELIFEYIEYLPGHICFEINNEEVVCIYYNHKISESRQSFKSRVTIQINDVEFIADSVDGSFKDIELRMLDSEKNYSVMFNLRESYDKLWNKFLSHIDIPDTYPTSI